MDLNSFHPERVVFMRKEILLPAVAVAGGGAVIAILNAMRAMNVKK